MDEALLAVGVGLAVGLSGAAFMVTVMQAPGGQAQGQQSGFGSYEVRRGPEGRIESIESFNTPPEFTPGNVQ